MSTRILSPKSFGTIAATLASLRSEAGKARGAAFRDLSLAVDSMFELAQKEASQVPERVLARHLVKQNRAEYEATYPHHDLEALAESWEDSLKYVDEASYTALPLSGKGLSTLQALLRDANYNCNTISKEHPLTEAFIAMEGKVARAVLKLMPDYPTEELWLPGVAMDMISVGTWGDSFYQEQNGLRNLFAKFEFDAQIRNGGGTKKIYGDDYVALLMKQVESGTTPVVLPTEQDNVLMPMPTIRSLAGNLAHDIRIQSDIPKPTAASVLRIAQAFHSLEEKISWMKPSDFIGSNGKPLDQVQYDQLSSKVSQLARTHDAMVTQSLAPFRKAYGLEAYGASEMSL